MPSVTQDRSIAVKKALHLTEQHTAPRLDFDEMRGARNLDQVAHGRGSFAEARNHAAESDTSSDDNKRFMLTFFEE